MTNESHTNLLLFLHIHHITPCLFMMRVCVHILMLRMQRLRFHIHLMIRMWLLSWWKSLDMWRLILMYVIMGLMDLLKDKGSSVKHNVSDTKHRSSLRWFYHAFEDAKRHHCQAAFIESLLIYRYITWYYNNYNWFI